MLSTRHGAAGLALAGWVLMFNPDGDGHGFDMRKWEQMEALDHCGRLRGRAQHAQRITGPKREGESDDDCEARWGRKVILYRCVPAEHIYPPAK